MTQYDATDFALADACNNRCRQTINAYIAAFNEGDMDRLACLLDETARLEDWAVLAEGKAAVLQATDAIIHAGPKLHVVLRRTIVEARHAAVDLTIQIQGAGELAVVDLIDFTPEGLIASIRAFKGAEHS